MPTLYARSTTVQLSVADLETTTTIDYKPSLGSNMGEVTNNAAEFARGSRNGTLTETPLYTDDSGTHMRFLGWHQNMPFFIVQAGKHFFDRKIDKVRKQNPHRDPTVKASQASPAHALRNLLSVVEATVDIADKCHHENVVEEWRRSKQPPEFKPYALCLTVYLSAASFLPLHNPNPKRATHSDVKIAVYFNGEFCGSSFVPERHRGPAYTMTEHIVRFSGRRIARLMEKPWVYVPPGQNPDRSIREHKRGREAYAGASSRWEAISHMLEAEAGSLGGGEDCGNPVLSEYLSSLVKLQMPPEVEEMQMVGGANFGVIDVIIITGKGHKDGASGSMLLEPTHLRNSNPKPSFVQEPSLLKPGVTLNRQDEDFGTPETDQQDYHQRKKRRQISPDIKPASFSPQALARNTEIHLRCGLSTTPRSSTRSIAARPDGEHGPFAPRHSGLAISDTSPTQPLDSYSSTLSGRQRSRWKPYKFVAEDRKTLAEEIETIAETAFKSIALTNSQGTAEETSTPIHMTRSSRRATAAASPPSRLESLHNPAETSSPLELGNGRNVGKLVKFKFGLTTATKPLYEHAQSPKTPGPAPRHRSTPSTSSSLSTLSTLPSTTAAPSPSSSPLANTISQPIKAGEHVACMYSIPPLSQDSVLTYAPGGRVRVIKAERNGSFEEDSVLMGVRFLVG